MFWPATLLALAFCVCYFAIDPQATWFGYGALEPRPRDDPRTGPAADRARRHPLGQQADGRPRDHRVPPPGGLQRRGPRGGDRRLQDRRRRVRLRSPYPRPQQPAGRARRARAARRRAAARPGAAARRLRSTTPSGARASGSSTTSPARRSSPADIELGQLVNAEPALFFPQQEPNGKVIPAKYDGTALNDAEGQGRGHPGPDAARGHPPDQAARRTGATTASSATPRSAPMSAARSACGSNRPTTCCARATSRRSTWPTAAGSSSARRRGHCRSSPIGLDSEGYLIAMHDFNEPVGPSFWERG